MWKVTKRSPILKQTKAASLIKLVFVKVGMTLQWTPDVKRLMLAGHKDQVGQGIQEWTK